MTNTLEPDGDGVRVNGDDNKVAGAGAHHNALGEGSSVNHYEINVVPPAAGRAGDPISRLLILIVVLLSLCLLVMARWGSARTIVLIVGGGVLVGATTVALRRRKAEAGEELTVLHADKQARARRYLLDVTDRLWVRDALEDSLESAVQLEVGLGEQRGAVVDPYGSSTPLALADGPRLPTGTRLRDLVRDRPGHRMLVLGDPGAGKTTHLLGLAADQIDAARADEHAPVPIVLLLSTWADGPDGLAGWVAAEARQRYMMDTSQTTTWLAAGSVMLLLDGLDEVDETLRDRCLAAIEEFCTDPRYRECSLVLTSRTQEFRELQRKLPVSSAVRVLPLSEEQIARTLAEGGPRLTSLRQAVHTEPALAGMLTTPLMLGVAVLAFARLEPGTSLPDGDHRRALFGLYVYQMLHRVRALRASADGSGTAAALEPATTYRHLVWLARLMSRQGQTIFYPDLMTPAWLPDRNPPWPLAPRRGLRGRLARRLGWDHTSTGLVGGQLATLAGAWSAAPLGALVQGVSGALLAACGGALILGGAVGLAFGVVFQSRRAERVSSPVVGKDAYNIYAATGWTWSAVSALRGLVTWVIFGALVCGALVLAGGTIVESSAVGAVLGCGGILAAGNAPDHERPPAVRGGALAASLRRLARLLLILTVAVLAAAVLVMAMGGPWTALLAAMPATLAFMMTAGPGRAWLRHRAAHYGARASGLLPADLERLLRSGEDRVLLRRVGGGYMFLHRDLQEYMGGCPPDDPIASLLSERQ
ncbi:NACHT domain-containing protein [Streptomyces cadmiisoli]|uniref:NACHT domain-containing protein n=1 Tax=Streptomyces cadmiisoli TaxID=2184053 RepID=UPI003D756FDF